MKRCLTCGAIIPAGHGYHTAQKYCNAQCYQRRNVPDKDELLKTLNKTDNITVTAQLFGVNKQALYNWMRMLKIKRKVEYV